MNRAKEIEKARRDAGVRLSRLTCAAKIESKIQWNAVKVFFRLKCKTYSELGRAGREGKYCNEKIGLRKENFILLCSPRNLIILNFSLSSVLCRVLCGEALGFSLGSFSVFSCFVLCVANDISRKKEEENME